MKVRTRLSKLQLILQSKLKELLAQLEFLQLQLRQLCLLCCKALKDLVSQVLNHQHQLLLLLPQLVHMALQLLTTPKTAILFLDSSKPLHTVHLKLTKPTNFTSNHHSNHIPNLHYSNTFQRILSPTIPTLLLLLVLLHLHPSPLPSHLLIPSQKSIPPCQSHHNNMASKSIS